MQGMPFAYVRKCSVPKMVYICFFCNRYVFYAIDMFFYEKCMLFYRVHMLFSSHMFFVFFFGHMFFWPYVFFGHMFFSIIKIFSHMFLLIMICLKYCML